MANDKDIKIGLQTVGADAAAREIDKVPDAIDKIPESVNPAVDAIDQVPDAIDKIPESVNPAVDAIDQVPEGIDKIPDAIEKIPEATEDAVDAIDDVVEAVEEIPDAMDEAGSATERMDQNLKKIRRAQTAQIIGQLAGQVAMMGGKFREVAGEVAEFDEGLARSLENAADNIEGVSSTVSSLAFAFGAGGPLGAALAGLGIMLAKTGEAWIEMRSAQEQARQSAIKFAEQQAFQASQQEKLRASIKNEFIAGVYKEEADQLARQVAAIERINQLRGELQSVEQSRANRQVDIARDSGGDVALAEANALAVKLRTGLDAINGELAAAQARAAEAERLADQSRMTYERAVNTGISPDDLDALAAAADAAKTDLETANQQFQDLTTTSAAQRVDFLEQIQEEYRTKFAESQPQINSEADRAFDQVYEGVKNALATGPQAALAQIQVEVGTITTAATGKAAEVQQGLSTERAGTVQAIQKLAPTPQDTAAITAAVRAVETAVATQGNAIIAALSRLTAGMEDTVVRINQQQTQINQIFSRIR